MNSELEKIAHMYGDVYVRVKKQRRKRQKLLVIDLLFDYAKNSTLHGLRYIVSRGLTVVEKVFWCIFFFASIILCAICIYKLYVKWITSPVIVTVNGRLDSVGTVPLPSVTICPQIRCSQHVYNYTEKLHLITKSNLSPSDLTEFEHISSICDEFIAHEHYKQMITDKSLVDDITAVALGDSIFEGCLTANYSTIPCRNLFSKVYTNEGLCYTANSLAARDIFIENSTQTDYLYLYSNKSTNGWSLEASYNYSEPNLYPRRGTVHASGPDMRIILRNDETHKDKSCNGLYSGYKIFLNHPADLPQSSLYYYAALPQQISALAISFHKLSSDLSLSDYPADIRQCYFPSERPLRYFKIYTMKNCLAECLSNYTYELCQCVEYYMPHNDSTEICTRGYRYCTSLARVYMANNETNIELGLTNDKCNCLPACNFIEYDAEVLRTEVNWQEIIKRLYGSKAVPSGVTFSQIDLYFKKPHFVTMKRSELYGVTDLLAQIGGLLGLFLGFSFLSLVEIVYFLTLRVGFALKRDLEEEKLKKITES